MALTIEHKGSGYVPIAVPCHVHWRAALVYTYSPTHQEFLGRFSDNYPNYYATEQRSIFKIHLSLLDYISSKLTNSLASNLLFADSSPSKTSRWLRFCDLTKKQSQCVARNLACWR